MSAPRSILSSADFYQVQSRDKDGDSLMKNLSQNACGRNSKAELAGPEHRARFRKWFASLLWSAFPGASERDVARRAAPVLDVSERQVINWLRGENDAAGSYVAAVMIYAGVMSALGPIRGRVS